MPAPHPPEFRKRAVELARERVKPIKEIARDIGISESCLRNWMGQADIDEGKREGLTSEERVELTRLRRENRVLRMERDLLSRAAAFFAHPVIVSPGGATVVDVKVWVAPSGADQHADLRRLRDA